MTNVERVLSALRAEPGLSDGELRERTQVNPTNMSIRFVDDLSEKATFVASIARMVGSETTSLKTVGRRPQALREIATTVTPDTLLHWHRQLVARKWTRTRLIST